MGQTQVSGLLCFTVYTRGMVPRHWVCGILEKQSGVLRSTYQLALLNPLGPDSLADVLITNLGVTPINMGAGQEGATVTGTFDGLHQFQAVLNTRRDIGNGQASVSNTWNAAFLGREGQLHILSIEFKVTSRTLSAANGRRMDSQSLVPLPYDTRLLLSDYPRSVYSLSSLFFVLSFSLHSQCSPVTCSCRSMEPR